MTPKEKAMQMTEKYIAPTMDRRLCGYIQSILVAKQCALIALDEILNTGKDVDEFCDSYWQDVKQEIEKL